MDHRGHNVSGELLRLTTWQGTPSIVFGIEILDEQITINLAASPDSRDAHSAQRRQWWGRPSGPQAFLFQGGSYDVTYRSVARLCEMIVVQDGGEGRQLAKRRSSVDVDEADLLAQPLQPFA